MEQNTRRITLSKGFQITLPSFARKKVGLDAGDEIEVDVRNGEIILKRAETREEAVKRVFRELEKMKIEREKHMTPEQKAFARKTAGWTINQYHEYIDNLPETKAYIKEKYGL